MGNNKGHGGHKEKETRGLRPRSWRKPGKQKDRLQEVTEMGMQGITEKGNKKGMQGITEQGNKKGMQGTKL